MTAPAGPMLESLLRLCADAAPAPWYPSQYARATGTDRDRLDEPLNQLRLAGLIRLTDWERGQGQGYALTDAGRAALESPRALAGLRVGRVPEVVPVAAEVHSRPMAAWDRGEAVRLALLGTGGAPVTFLLVAVQVSVFIAGLSLALQQQIPLSDFLFADVGGLLGHAGQRPAPARRAPIPLINELAVSAGAVAAGQWWRLLTYAFVHAGALHLLCNSLGHRALGPPIERMIGSVRFLILWLVSALGGGGAVVLAGEAAIGSSGAVCGLLGAMVSLILLNRRYLGPELTGVLQRWLLNALILTAVISAVPGVSWSGHLGGAVVGLVAGALLNYQRFGTVWQRWAAVLGLVLLPVVCIAVVERSLVWSGETKRQADIRRQNEEQQRQWRETVDFRGRIEPEVNRVTLLTQRVCYDQARLLFQLAPAFRDGDQVRAAIVRLDTLSEDQEAVHQLAATAGPYQVPGIREAQRRASELLDEEAKLAKLTRESLRSGQANDREWVSQIRRWDEAVLQWQRATAIRPDAKAG